MPDSSRYSRYFLGGIHSFGCSCIFSLVVLMGENMPDTSNPDRVNEILDVVLRLVIFAVALALTF